MSETMTPSEIVSELDKHIIGQHKAKKAVAVALRNLVPSHFMDPRQFDFKGLVPNGVADADGDKAFDAEELPAQAVGMLGGLPLMPR